MADIDKSLPNVEQEIKVPSPEDIEVAQQEEQQKITEEGEPVEITENEDGSVDVNYDPSIASVEGEINHYDNLAEHLPDDILGRLELHYIKIIKTIKILEKIGREVTEKV